MDPPREATRSGGGEFRRGEPGAAAAHVPHEGSLTGVTTYASISGQEKTRVYADLGQSITALARQLGEHPHVYSQLSSTGCNPKSVYWDLPAFLAPLVGSLANQLRQGAEHLEGWLFLDDIPSPEPPAVIINLVRLAALLEQFQCRLADGRVVCTEAARSALLDDIKKSRLLPGPARLVEALLQNRFGRAFQQRTLASLIEQTLTPGMTLELDKVLVVFSLDRKPELRDVALGLMRLWTGPLTIPDIYQRLRRLSLTDGSEYELELELQSLKAEGHLAQKDGQFFLPTERQPEVGKLFRADLPNLIFQSLFKICTADQVVVPAEIAAIRNLMAVEFELSEAEREPFDSLLNLAVHQSLGHAEIGEQLSREQVLAVPQELRDRLFRAAAVVVIIDYEVHRHERAALLSLADELQISLRAETVVTRYEEIARSPGSLVEWAYFGVLPDISDPTRLSAKLLRAHNHYLRQLSRSCDAALKADAQRLQEVLRDFHSSHPFAEPLWLLHLDFQDKAIPSQALLPLDCLLRVARADGPSNELELKAVARLVAQVLDDDPQRALWNLNLPDLAALPLPEGRLPDDDSLELRQRCLSLAMGVALCDGALNPEESRELLAVATELGFQEDSFRLLHVLAKAASEHFHGDPDLDRADLLEMALLEAARRVPPPASPAPSLGPEPPPRQIPEHDRPFLMVIRPNGKSSFTIHVRVRPELAQASGGSRGDAQCPPGSEIWKDRLQAFIDSTRHLKEGCQGRTWFICKSPAACLEVLNEVKDQPFEVLWPNGQPFQVLGTAGVHNLNAYIRQSHGWFEIGGRLQLGQGVGIDLLDLVTRVRTSGEYLAVTPDTFISLDDSLRQALEQLEGLLPENIGDGRLDGIRARLLAGQANFFNDETNNQEFSRLEALLEEARELVPDLPADLWDCLRDYQKEGVHWILRTTHAGFGACLADDMGLGKTLQTLCLLYHCRSMGTSLVVAPTSVTYNWKEQAERFTPDLRILLYEGPGPIRHTWLDQLQDWDLVVMSYGIMQKDHAFLRDRQWNVLVLDEAQKIKNPSSVTARAAFDLLARARLCTTGTPIENHLVELWSLMNFLNPGLLGTENSFRQQYAPGSLRGGDASEEDYTQRLLRLRGQVAHFILRRRKETVAPQLPPKLVTVHRIDLTSEERDLYNRIRREALMSKAEDRITLLSALTRLRQVCCDPGLIDAEWSETSSKIQAALEMLSEVTQEGHQVLVFSQFVSLLKRLAHELASHGLPYQELYGSTSLEDRRQLVQEFQGGRFPIFLISLKAGGTGLTLTRADYVIHLDPWWNPAVEDQATDRAHRIGQNQTVNVYRFIARETVEEKVLELHAQKRELAETVLGHDEAPTVLTLDELRALI